MNVFRNLTKNAAVLFASYGINAVLGMSMQVLIARTSGSSTLGQYSFAQTFSGIFGLLIGLGFPTIIIREVARRKELADKFLGNILAITTLLSIIVFFLMLFTALLMGYSGELIWVVLIFGVYTIATCFGDLFRVSFRAFERMEFEAILSVIVKLFIVSVSIALLLTGYGILQIALTYALGGLLDVGLSAAVWQWKFTKLKFAFDYPFWKTCFWAAIPIGLLSIANVIFSKLDTVLLTYFKGDAATGLFTAAYGPVLAIEPIAFIIYTVLLPRMSMYSLTSLSELKSLFEKSIRYMLIVSVPLSLAMMLIAGRIVKLFYGDQFDGSVDPLRFLAWHILFYFLCAIMQTVLLATNRQNKMVISTCICAAINAICNIFLIPHFSYVGSAIAALVTQAALFSLYLFFISKSLYPNSLFMIMGRSMVACIPMAIFLYIFPEINLVIMIISSVVLYFSALYLVKGIDIDDLNLIKHLWFAILNKFNL